MRVGYSILATLATMSDSCDTSVASRRGVDNYAQCHVPFVRIPVAIPKTTPSALQRDRPRCYLGNAPTSADPRSSSQ